MRIITGEAKGVRLETLEGDATRPTAERVKEAVFSALQFEIENARVLDLFAGSGQIGLEAISRGASLAVMVDSSPDAIAIIKTNAKKSKLFDRCRIVNYHYRDYLKGFARSGDRAFDFVYIDPPFGARLYEEILQRLAASGAIDGKTKIIVESDDPSVFSDTPSITSTYELTKTVKYGRIYVTYFRLLRGVNTDE